MEQNENDGALLDALWSLEDGKEADDPPRSLVDELESCSKHLQSLFGQAQCEDDDTGDDTTQSAANMAAECLLLLQALDQASSDSVEVINVTEMTANRDDEGPSDLLEQEIDTFAAELGRIMATLDKTEPTGEIKPLFVELIPSEAESGETELTCSGAETLERNTHTMARRLSLHLEGLTPVRRRRSFPSLTMPLHQSKVKLSERFTSTNAPKRPLAAHQVLNTPEFWRQYQGKSFSQHITRQQHARKERERAATQEQEAIAYHYRKASKRIYPLAKKKKNTKSGLDTEKSMSPTYLSRYATAGSPVRTDSDALGKKSMLGLLCGVYLYSQRHARTKDGVLYLTCSSLEQLKTRIAERLNSPPVLNLYRERSIHPHKDKPTKSLSRIASFHGLRNGDMVCATTDAYEDMAILCSWMKKRQRNLHRCQSPAQHLPPDKDEKETNSPSVARNASTTPSEPTSSFDVELWDENGRRMRISKALLRI